MEDIFGEFSYLFILMVIVIAIIDPSTEKPTTAVEPTPVVTNKPVTPTEEKISWMDSIVAITNSDKYF